MSPPVNRPKRVSRPLLAAIIAGGVAVGIGLNATNVSAQNYGAQNYASQNMRPVPRTGQVGAQATTPNPTRQGWNLKWRRSSNVAPDTFNEQAANPTRQQPSRAVVPTSGTLSVATDRPQLQAVAPAAYLNSPQRVESLLDSTAGYRDQPNNRIAQNRPTERASTMTLVQSGDMLFPPLDDQPVVPTPDPFAEAPQANDLRDSLNTLDAPTDLFDMPAPQRAAEPLPVPEPTPQQSTQPNPSLKKMDDGPSLGDLLKDTEPDELPEPKSPSNRPSDEKDLDDEDFENPFGRSNDRDSDRDTDNDLREKDRRDRDRLNLDGPDRDEDRDSSLFDDEQDEDLKKTEGLSCNDFRSRIQRQTIDQVSLDISPPYRPDEIDQSRYDKLKAKFDEKQAVRQWRNMSGVPMTTGRLRDIAYEKVVVETEYGSTESIPIDQLSEGDLAYLSENWGLPQECRLEQVAYVQRSWTPMTMTYLASNLCHNPLYFEDVNLERYGHTHGPVLEPIIQTAHFFGNIAVLPYKMGVHCPTECQYALGYYRPGNCAPWIKPPVPLSVKGGIAQAATMTGLFWLIP
ncbi:hypothetical protein LF1_12700 [Rubripirellula obstinata]|uniref:Uncharacterized protein n=1 Tax=Rubripirellula obstinata TaxID=406547 RepID=A0A5B1CC86_9BACT|nr:hypothetical protein LF1_12700 [Rubripirellula obstinata]